MSRNSSSSPRIKIYWRTHTDVFVSSVTCSIIGKKAPDMTEKTKKVRKKVLESGVRRE